MPDPVKMAKDISKLTKLPLPKVAAIMQKYPLDAKGMLKAYEECRVLGVAQFEKDLKGIFNI